MKLRRLTGLVHIVVPLLALTGCVDLFIPADMSSYPVNGYDVPPADDAFTVVALPDTQYYSQSYPEIFSAQTAWIVANRETWNIQFVAHLGDIVNQAGLAFQWTNAKTAMDALLDADIPHGTCVGNHDILYPVGYDDPDGANYLAHFGPSFYADRAWYGGASPSGLSNYQVIEVGGLKLLFLHLLLETPRAELDWAQAVLDANRDRPTMVSTHRYLSDWRILGAGRYTDFNYAFEPLYRTDGLTADEFWSTFVSVNPQIYLLVCGHNDGQYRQVSTNAAGLPVHEVLVDYQNSWSQGGDGFLRLMVFRPTESRIDVSSFSPTADSFDPGGDDTFSLAVDFGAYAATGERARPAAAR